MNTTIFGSIYKSSQSLALLRFDQSPDLHYTAVSTPNTEHGT